LGVLKRRGAVAAARGRGTAAIRSRCAADIGTTLVCCDFCNRRAAFAPHYAANRRPLRIGIISLSTHRTGSDGALRAEPGSGKI
jgi:hypothetical protein